MQSGDAFQIEMNELSLQVTSHVINTSEVFRMIFSDKRPPLVVTEAVSNGRSFWTSVPQGRQKEAAFFGKLIEEKLKK